MAINIKTPEEIEKMIMSYKDQLESTEKFKDVLVELEVMHEHNTETCNNCCEKKYSLNWVSWKNMNFCENCLDEMGMEIDDFPDEEDERHPYAMFTH